MYAGVQRSGTTHSGGVASEAGCAEVVTSPCTAGQFLGVTKRSAAIMARAALLVRR
ncbi:hypothetical protein P3T16_000933 [Paraburkholderia sp. GAS42]